MKTHIKTLWTKGIKTRDLRIFLGIWMGIFAVFAIFGFQKDSIRIWAIVGIFISFALLFSPKISSPLYRVWLIIGEGIGFCISRCILLLLFFGLFSPIGIFFRLIGRDILKQRFDKKATSYFIVRHKQPQSMKNQF